MMGSNAKRLWRQTRLLIIFLFLFVSITGVTGKSGEVQEDPVRSPAVIDDPKSFSTSAEAEENPARKLFRNRRETYNQRTTSTTTESPFDHYNGNNNYDNYDTSNNVDTYDTSHNVDNYNNGNNIDTFNVQNNADNYHNQNSVHSYSDQDHVDTYNAPKKVDSLNGPNVFDNELYHFVTERSSSTNNKDEDMDGMDDSGNWQWCLLSIAGNKTIVQRRRRDFIHYLRMNVASLIGSVYERVTVNTVTYIPDLVINVTLDWDLRERIVRVLGRVADDRDILLDLSGQHFNLTGFVPSSALLAPKPVAHLEADDNLLTAKQIESLVFTVVGVAIAFLLTASLLFGICQCAVSTRRRKLNENRMRASQSASTNIEEEVDLTSGSVINHIEAERSRLHYQQQQQQQQQRNRGGPNLIYSPGFSNTLIDGVQVAPSNGSGRYTPIDDSLAPIERFEEESYIPRFVLRNGSSATPTGSTTGAGPPPRRLRFRGDGLMTDSEDDLAKLMSPHSETDTLLSWPQAAAAGGGRPSSSATGGRPRRRERDNYGVPRRAGSTTGSTGGGSRRAPPYDLTLRPNSAFLYHPPPLRSELSKNRRASVQNYIDNDDLPTPILSSFKSPTTSFQNSPSVISKPTPEEIERDVNIIFRNMGIDRSTLYQ